MISLEIYQYEYFSIGFRGWFYYILTLTPVIHRILYLTGTPASARTPVPGSNFATPSINLQGKNCNRINNDQISLESWNYLDFSWI